jgi:hypothetical protein
MVLGMILLMVGGFWALPILGFILQAIQYGFESANIFGLTLSPLVAAVVALTPPAIIIGIGVYLLLTLPKDRF